MRRTTSPTSPPSSWRTPASLVSLLAVVVTAYAPYAAAEEKAALPESVAYKLEQAKSAYQQKVGRFRADLRKDLEVKENQARSKGDKKLVDQLKAELDALDAHGQLPHAVPTAAYEARVRQARAEAEAAFNGAVKELVRARKDDQAAEVERRLAAFQKEADAAAGSVDLLAMIEPAKDAVAGPWQRNGSGLTVESPANVISVLQIPYAPPAEYEVELVVERLKTAGETRSDIQLGGVLGGRRFYVVLDGWNATTSGISFIGGRGASDNAATFHGKLFTDGRPARVLARFTAEGVTVTVDGKPAIKYAGPADRLGGGEGATPDRDALFLVVEKNGAYRIESLRLKPLVGQGRPLR